MSLTHEQRRARRREIAAFSIDHTDAETVDKFGCCRLTVKHARREFGFKKRPEMVQQTSSQKTLRILARLLNGEKQSVIVKDTGLTRQRISAIFKSAQAAGLIAVRKGKPKKEKRT